LAQRLVTLLIAVAQASRSIFGPDLVGRLSQPIDRNQRLVRRAIAKVDWVVVMFEQGQDIGPD
jgi:hypothetical protein